MQRGLLVLLLLAPLGCGDDRIEVVPVEGTITNAGGSWTRPGLVYFAPLEPAPGYPRQPGIADIEVDGTFRATTQPDRDGLVPGKYRASLEIWQVPPTMGGPPAKSDVAAKYRAAATSGLEVVVPADSSGAVEVQWDIPRAK